MLDVRRMRVLREVAVRGSFSAAAESLSFTQSAISQQIAALEREAGCTLVQRNARGIRLTEAGGLRLKLSLRQSPGCAAAACGWRRSSQPPRR
jgi:DNA-binding transcriptional LysR family regulator